MSVATILVVDDEPLIRWSLVERLRAEGYEVLEAATGGEALDRAREGVDLVIAATNRDLEEDVRAGRFRQDLFHRLNVLPITLPTRQHLEDVPALLASYIDGFNREFRKHVRA